MRYTLPYGETTQSVDLDGFQLLTSLEIADTPALENVPEHLQQALAPLGDAFSSNESVVIVVSDGTRWTGVDQYVSILLNFLSTQGIQEKDIAFLFATGTHRAPTEAEKSRILGATIYSRFRQRTFPHDPKSSEQLIHVGDTTRGTPVWLNRRAVEADHLIVTGGVTFHYFGGFGGGRKSILPGIAGLESIAVNHARNLHPTEDQLNPDVRIGVMKGNPVAEDMQEAAGMIKVDLLINAVMNRQGEIAGLFAGELASAHRAATDFAANLYAVPLDEPADLVIASAGKAANFIQSHKALFNAWQAVKPEGYIILLAPAPEGLGNPRFAEWLALKDRAAIIARLREQAEINGQTALSTREKTVRTLIITELSEEDVALLGAEKAPDLQAAVNTLRHRFAQQGITSPTCRLMPSASYTVPFRK